MALPSPLQPSWKKTRKLYIEDRLEKKKLLLEKAEKNRKKWEEKQKGKEINKFLEKNPNLKDDLNVREEDFGIINENLGNDEDIYREVKRPKPSLFKIISNKWFDWNLKRRSKKLAKTLNKLESSKWIPTEWELSYSYNPFKFTNYLYPGEKVLEGEVRNKKRRRKSFTPKEIVRTVRYLNFLFWDFISLDKVKHGFWWFNEKDEELKEYILIKEHWYVTNFKSASLYVMANIFYERFILKAFKCYLVLSAADILWFCKSPQMHYYIRLYNPDVFKDAVFCFGVIIALVSMHYIFCSVCTFLGRHTFLYWFRTRFVIFFSTAIATAMCSDKFMNLECFTYYWAIYFPFSMYCFYIYTQALWGTEEEILYENFLELFTVWFTYSVIYILPKKVTPFDVELHLKKVTYDDPKEHIADPYTVNLDSMYMGPEESIALPPEAEALVVLYKLIGPTGLKQKKKEVLEEPDRIKRLMMAYDLWYNLEGLRGEGTLQTLMTFKRHKYYWRVFWNKGFWVE